MEISYIVAGASLEVLGSAERKPVGLAHRSVRESIICTEATEGPKKGNVKWAWPNCPFDRTALTAIDPVRSIAQNDLSDPFVVGSAKA